MNQQVVEENKKKFSGQAPVKPSFSWMIDPMPEEEFFKNYYEKKICLISRQDPSYYNSVLNLSDINDLLYHQQLTFPKTKLVDARHDIESKDYASNNLINHAKMLRYFEDGSTIVFSSLHDNIPSLNHLCSTLQASLFHRFQTNIYFTPPQAQGFKVHYDDHDVFILQTSGTKRWRIYGTPIELPMRSQRFEPGIYEEGEMVQEFEMKAGDFLYVPRGVMHEALSTDEHSLHITLGFLGYTWADLFVQSVGELAKKEPMLRKNLPIGFGSRNAIPEAEKEYFQSLLQLISDKLDLRKAYNIFTDDLIEYQRPRQNGQLEQIMQLDKIQASAQLSRHTEVLFSVKTTEESVLIKLYDQEVIFPLFMKPAVDFMATNEYFGIKDIPDCVNEAGKITFVKKLVKEGLLKVESL